MANSKPTIGLPKMHVEPGEKRVFLPAFTATLQKMGFAVVLEKEYGSSIGLADDDYLALADKITITDLEQVYQQDYVLVLR